MKLNMLTRKRARDRSDLHKNGFVIHKNVIVIPRDISTFTNLADKTSKMIFNHNNNQKNDRRRKQASVPSNLQKRGLIKEANAYLHKQYPRLSPDSPVILKSTPGCQEQAAHCDYQPTKEMILCDDDNVPCGCIVPLMEDATICIWPSCINYEGKEKKIEKEIVSLEAGDILVFRGDLVHAGSSYTKTNYRIHIFLDSEKVTRKKNKTHLV
jgi:hypothetical protein